MPRYALLPVLSDHETLAALFVEVKSGNLFVSPQKPYAGTSLNKSVLGQQSPSLAHVCFLCSFFALCLPRVKPTCLVRDLPGALEA